MSDYHHQALLLKTLGHPARLRILDILRRDAECVCHLSAALHKPQPYISQHLAVLRELGAICDERDGVNVYYRFEAERAGALVEAALGSVAQEARQRQPIQGCPCPKCRQSVPCAQC